MNTERNIISGEIHFKGDRIIKCKSSIEKIIYERLGIHYNIPLYYGSHSDDCIIIEYIKNSDVISSFFESGEELYYLVMLQLLSVVEYIHSKGVLHTDLSNPENILYVKSNNRIIIIDFEGAIFDTNNPTFNDITTLKHDYRCIACIG